MAVYPCDYCGERYKGPQTTFYPAFLHLGRAIRAKRRSCPTCAERAESVLRTKMHAITDNAPGLLCDWCDDQLGGVLVFCTAYFPKQEREDFWGYACGWCTDTEAGMQLFGPLRPEEAIAGYSAYLTPSFDQDGL